MRKSQGTLFFIALMVLVIIVLFIVMWLIMNIRTKKVEAQLEVEIELFEEGRSLTKFLATQDEDKPQTIEIIGSSLAKGADKKLMDYVKSSPYDSAGGAYLLTEKEGEVSWVFGKSELRGASTAHIPIPGAGKSGHTRVTVEVGFA